MSDEKVVEIAKEYLHEMGIIDTQYVIAKHVDKNYPHLNLIANLVNNRGQAINDSWIELQGKKVAQKLTIKRGLRQAESKNLYLKCGSRQVHQNLFILFYRNRRRVRLTLMLPDGGIVYERKLYFLKDYLVQEASGQV